MLPKEPPGQHHVERIEDKLVGVSIVVEWVSAVVKRSAGLDCASVTPLRSVVIPGSTSFSPPKTA